MEDGLNMSIVVYLDVEEQQKFYKLCKDCGGAKRTFI